jgi:hypothetical protein
VSGQSTTLSVSLCHDATGPGQVRFPRAQQAAWQLYKNNKVLLWSSNQAGTPFRAGEVVTVAASQCLRWQVRWQVTASGRSLPKGTYQLLWTTGADLHNPTLRSGYHDNADVNIR